MNNILIGVGGGTGAGKTTLAREIVTALEKKDVVILHQDSYYKDLARLKEEGKSHINYDHPLAFENELLARHLELLKQNLPIEVPIYDYVNHCRKEETRTVNPVRVIVLEGLLVLEDRELRDLMDIKIFVDTDSDIRLIRRIKRDTKERGRSLDSIIEQYLDTVRPMHMEFVEKSKRYADIIVPGGSNTTAIEMIVARVKEFIQRQEQKSEFGN